MSSFIQIDAKLRKVNVVDGGGERSIVLVNNSEGKMFLLFSLSGLLSTYRRSQEPPTSSRRSESRPACLKASHAVLTLVAASPLSAGKRWDGGWWTELLYISLYSGQTGI